MVVVDRPTAITSLIMPLCSTRSMHLRWRFDRAFRAAFGHGQRLRAAHELGNYVMARA